eukprot:scaffold115263_cov69-Phaeocystis_antarctica.AAC.2
MAPPRENSRTCFKPTAESQSVFAHEMPPSRRAARWRVANLEARGQRGGTVENRRNADLAAGAARKSQFGRRPRNPRGAATGVVRNKTCWLDALRVLLGHARPT